MMPNDLVCSKVIVQSVILVSGVDERGIELSVQVGAAVRKRRIGIDWGAVECGQFVLAGDVVGEEPIRMSLEHERELLYSWRGACECERGSNYGCSEVLGRPVYTLLTNHNDEWRPHIILQQISRREVHARRRAFEPTPCCAHCRPCREAWPSSIHRLNEGPCTMLPHPRGKFDAHQRI